MSLIVKIGADTRAFEKDMKKLTKDVNLVADRLNSVGQTLTSKVTVPIGIAAAAVVKLGMDFEASMSKLQGVTGASGKELQALQKTAIDMGSDTKYSATEAADAMTELAKAGMNSKQTMDAIPGVLSMAATENMNLADAASITSSILNGFGMSADQAGHVADVLAKNSNMSATGVEGLGAAMRNVAGFASQLGLSFEDVNAAIGIMANNGIDGALAGDKLNQILRAMAAPSNEASKEMKALGINVFDANGKMKSLPEVIGIINDKTKDMGDAQKLAALKTIFGSDAIAGLLPLLKSGQKGMAEYSGSLKDSAGFADKMAKITNDNLKGALDNLSSSLETAAIKLYQQIAPALKDVVGGITNLITKFSNLSPEAQKNIIILAGIAASIGPIIIGIAKLIKAIGEFQVMIGAIRGAEGIWAGLSAAAGGPIGLIIIAIMALIAVIALIILNWDKIKAATIAVWNSIVSFLSGIWDQIKGPILEVWNTVSGAAVTAWNAIVAVWNTVVDFFTNIWNSIVTSLAPLWGEISGAFQEAWDVIKLIWDLVAPYFQGVWELIKGVFGVVGAVLGMFFKDAWAIIKGVWDVVAAYFELVWVSIKAIFSVVGAILGGFFEVAWTAIKAVWNVAVAFFTLVWAGIKAIFAVVKGILSGDFSDAYDAIKDVWDKAKAFFGTVWDGIKSVFSAVGSWFGSVFSTAWTAIKNVFSGWGSFFGSLWDSIKSTFSALGSNLASAVGGALKSGINGILGYIQGIINSAVGAINGAINLINKIPGVSVSHVSTVSLPRMATGGSLFGNGAAIVGEAGPELVQKSGTSVKVTPLSAQEKAQGIGGAMGGSGFNGTIEIPVVLDGKVIAKVTAPFMNNELKNIKNNRMRAGGAY